MQFRFSTHNRHFLFIHFVPEFYSLATSPLPPIKSSTYAQHLHIQTRWSSFTCHSPSSLPFSLALAFVLLYSSYFASSSRHFSGHFITARKDMSNGLTTTSANSNSSITAIISAFFEVYLPNFYQGINLFCMICLLISAYLCMSPVNSDLIRRVTKIKS